MTPARARAIIERYLQTIDTNRFHTEIAFYGGSFTAIDAAEQTALLEAAQSFFPRGVRGIRLSTRPDCISRDILNRLKPFGVTEIELGVQSMSDRVLQANGRGHTANDARQAAKLVKEYGFTLGLQMMTGLFQSSDGDDVQTARELVRLHPDFVRIYPTLVFAHTDLEQWYRAGRYQPHTVGHAAALCGRLKQLFDEAGIPVIRIGLLVTADAEKSLLAGPYHPRFRELAEQAKGGSYAVKGLGAAGV